jgi:hypothetical protein
MREYHDTVPILTRPLPRATRDRRDLRNLHNLRTLILNEVDHCAAVHVHKCPFT